MKNDNSKILYKAYSEDHRREEKWESDPQNYNLILKYTSPFLSDD